ncbi:SecDF P1 head subdomain-containing protein [Bradyrhizobium sp.]|uniref:SecDF P1 head subdomain-containing protein n=1 Tax=Bradyrhizobium sp. TaxID=376 RepID=UPI0039E5EE8A
MTTPLRDRIARLIAALAIGAAITLPGGAGAEENQIDKMRAKVSALAGTMMEKLGGSRIDYRVDTDGLREAVLTDLRDDVYRNLREGRIAFSGLAIHDGSVEVRIADAGSRDQFLRKLASDATPARAPGTADGGDGLIRLTPSDTAFASRLHELVDDSIAMIEQRLKDDGVKFASVQPDGPDRIRIFLPGVMEPEHTTAIFARKVTVSFRLIDVSIPAEQAQAGSPPPNAEVLLGSKDQRPYLVTKDIVLGGDDISYAGPGYATGTQDPIASFHFNGRGTRRFAHITAENVGRPFAIVLDDKVISAPVIREPITGGSGQISGNFTLEEANSVAMMLRAGSLPGHLTLVAQQIVQPAAKP